MDGVRLTRLRVRNYRGIAAIDQDIPEHGMTVKGPNGLGKTSVIRAIRAALAAQDIGPDAVRHGETAAEIVVDLDHATVRRVITHEGSTVQVTRDGKPVPGPVRWLKELLGAGPLDPIEFYGLKDRARLEALLAAIPITVDPARLMGHVPPEVAAASSPPAPDPSAHALAACAALVKHFYDHRTQVNRQVKDEESAIERLGGSFVAPVHDPGPELEAARRAEAALEARVTQARADVERTEASRAKARSLREEAANARAFVEADLKGMAPMPDLDAALASAAEAEDARFSEMARADAEVATAEGELIAARVRADGARAALTDARVRVAECEHLRTSTETRRAAMAVRIQRADDLDGLAHSVEGAINVVTAPTPVEIHAAKERVRLLVEEQQSFARVEEVTRMQVRAQASRELAGKLTTMVDRFRDELPAQLLREANAIPGVTIDGTRIFLDGVDIDSACGKERLLLAVEIARRANARAKLLVVDGVEVLDPESFRAFTRAATADGWQLIATRVDGGGDVVFEAIELEGA